MGPPWPGAGGKGPARSGGAARPPGAARRKPGAWGCEPGPAGPGRAGQGGDAGAGEDRGRPRPEGRARGGGASSARRQGYRALRAPARPGGEVWRVAVAVVPQIPAAAASVAFRA